MNRLQLQLAWLVLILGACIGHCANPDFRGLYGTNGIIVRTNPVTGYVGIDGAAIVAGTNVPSTSTNAIGAPITNLLWGNTLFVDVRNGNDATALRGDASKPWLTASSAVANAQSGDTVLFRPGTYTLPMVGFLTNSPLNTIYKTNMTFAGMDGARIQANGLGTLWTVRYCSNIVFRDLELTGVRTNNVIANQSAAFWIEGTCQNMRWERCKMGNHQNHGIGTFRDPNDGYLYRNWTVEACDFWDIGWTNTLVGLPEDGVAVSLYGQTMRLENSTFFNCLRAFETANNTTFPQVWKDYVIQGNLFEGSIQSDLWMNSTNNQNFVIANNVFRSYSTNLPTTTERFSVSMYGATDFIFSGNIWDGSKYCIVFKEDAEGVADGLQIRNNIFRNVSQVPIIIERAVGTSRAEPRRIAISQNYFDTISSVGILLSASHSEITENQFHSVAAAAWIGNRADMTNATNMLIRGNVVGGTTTDSFIIGARAWNTKIHDNYIYAGSAINMGSANGVSGLLGSHPQNFLDNATLASVFTCYDPDTGQGNWQSVVQIIDGQSIQLSNLIVTATISGASNANFFNLYVTNLANLSNACWRAAESDWCIWASGLTESLYLDNNSYGRWLEFDPLLVGFDFHKPIFATNLTLFGLQTNKGDLHSTASGYFQSGLTAPSIRLTNDHVWRIANDGTSLNIINDDTGLAALIVNNTTDAILVGTVAQTPSITLDAPATASYSLTVTHNLGHVVGTVAGVGGANTNFTILANNDERIIWADGGTTNVNIVAIMGGVAGMRWAGTAVFTNRTGTARALSLGATTNNWISLQALNAGISAPATITNSLALRLDWEIVGTSNVFYSIVHHALPAP